MESFKFGELEIFENELLKQDRNQLATIIGYSGNRYSLDDSYSANRTVLCKRHHKTIIIQLIINTSVFDVVIPTIDQTPFKEVIFEELLEYFAHMIKLGCPEYSIANEIGFKINFYVESNSPASIFSWWVIDGEKISDKYGWKSEIVSKTALGKPLYCDHKRISMNIEFNTSFYIGNVKHNTTNQTKPRFSKKTEEPKTFSLEGFYSNPSAVTKPVKPHYKKRNKEVKGSQTQDFCSSASSLTVEKIGLRYNEAGRPHVQDFYPNVPVVKQQDKPRSKKEPTSSLMQGFYLNPPTTNHLKPRYTKNFSCPNYE